MFLIYCIDKKWIIFDGPVDALWIENMNTVLDDNKKLCLSNGEIIPLTSSQTMMFEVGDLQAASPATVSRCGMIYMEPADLGIDPLVKSWLLTLPEIMSTYRPGLQKLFDTFLAPSLSFLRKNMKEIVPTVDCQMVQSLLNIIECWLHPYYPEFEDEDPSKAQSKLPTNFNITTEYFFFFGLVWSIGASTDHEGRRKFDTYLRGEMNNGIKAIFPPEGTVYDYCYNSEKQGWVHWMTTIPEFSIRPAMNFSEIIVPTIDSVRNTFLLDLLLSQGKHVLCVGPTGTGKSVTIVEKLTKAMPPEITPVFINFSARTTENQIQDILDAKFDKRRKGVFGPPAGRKFIISIDDVNMPVKEKYGAQPAIELLRQWMVR